MTSRRRVLRRRTTGSEESRGPMTRMRTRGTPIEVQSLAERKKRGLRKEQQECSSETGFKGSEVEVSSPSYALDFMTQLYQLYKDGVCCDVVLSTGDFQTTAHKVVLMASSLYFKSFFQAQGSSCNFISLPSDISSVSLQAMMTFLYTGSLHLNFDNVLFLLSTAERLEIMTAVHLCNKFCSDNDVPMKTFSLETLDSSLDKKLEIEIKSEVTAEELPEVREYWPFSSYGIEQLSATSCNAAFAESQKLESVPKKKRGRRPKTQMDCIKMKEQASVSSSKPWTENNTCTSKNVKQKHSHSSSHGVMHFFLTSGVALKCDCCKLSFRFHSGLLHHKKWRHNVALPSLSVKIARRLIYQSIFTKYSRPFLIADGFSNGSTYLCPFCRRHFTRASWGLAHVLKLHFSQNLHRYRPTKVKTFGHVRRSSEPRLPYKCSSCPRVFCHLSNLRLHCSKDHRSKSDRHYRELYKEEKSQTREWRCQESGCGLRFTGGENLKRHMAITHSLVTFSCPDCKFTSQVEKLFLRHKEQKHGALKICHICGKGCHKAYQLKQHLYVHHKIKDQSLKLFKCPKEDCGYECISRKRLEDHSRRHSLVKSLKCDTCGKAFKHSIGLERHVKTIHQGIRPFICDQCGLAFGLEHELKTHASRHSDHKPHACDLCSFRSFNKSSLKLHLYSQHSIETNLKISMHKCNQCSFETSRRGRFEDHLKKHGNVKDVQCPECGKMFFTKKNLYGHRMKVHRPKSLCCSYCNFSTAIRSKFKCHMRTRHHQFLDA